MWFKANFSSVGEEVGRNRNVENEAPCCTATKVIGEALNISNKGHDERGSSSKQSPNSMVIGSKNSHQTLSPSSILTSLNNGTCIGQNTNLLGVSTISATAQSKSSVTASNRRKVPFGDITNSSEYGSPDVNSTSIIDCDTDMHKHNVELLESSNVFKRLKRISSCSHVAPERRVIENTGVSPDVFDNNAALLLYRVQIVLQLQIPIGFHLVTYQMPHKMLRSN